MHTNEELLLISVRVYTHRLCICMHRSRSPYRIHVHNLSFHKYYSSIFKCDSLREKDMVKKGGCPANRNMATNPTSWSSLMMSCFHIQTYRAPAWCKHLESRLEWLRKQWVSGMIFLQQCHASFTIRSFLSFWGKEHLFLYLIPSSKKFQQSEEGALLWSAGRTTSDLWSFSSPVFIVRFRNKLNVDNRAHIPLSTTKAQTPSRLAPMVARAPPIAFIVRDITVSPRSNPVCDPVSAANRKTTPIQLTIVPA